MIIYTLEFSSPVLRGSYRINNVSKRKIQEMFSSLFYGVVIELTNRLETIQEVTEFSSPVLRGSYRIKINGTLYIVDSVLVPVLRGSYRIDSSLNPITSIFQSQNLLSKIMTNHLDYKCRMSHF